MKKICYVANMSSPHVQQWLSLIGPDIELSIATIDNQVDATALGQYQFKVGEIICLPKFINILPKSIRYVILGFFLRIKRTNYQLLHAHNTSGYGLVALISGLNYVVTTYGSEIYRYHEESWLYRLLIGRVLKKANVITASTPYMKKFLLANFSSLDGKILDFSLGVRDVFLASPSLLSNSADYQRPVWFSNRRVLPLYRTLEIVRAFKKYKNHGGRGSLIVLQGDAVDDYVNVVRKEIEHESEIVFIEGFVDTKSIIKYLDESDYVISIPESDQLSSSILEGMARGCLPILSKLDAYDPVSDKVLFIENGPDLVDSLVNVFLITSGFSVCEYEKKSTACRGLIQSHFSKEKAQVIYLGLLNDLSES